eukprot:1161910-Pelagomonas_calceolata.AAC.4
MTLPECSAFRCAAHVISSLCPHIACAQLTNGLISKSVSNLPLRSASRRGTSTFNLAFVLHANMLHTA